MKPVPFFVLAAFFWSVPTPAALLSVSPGDREIEGVKISREARAKLEGREYQLKTVGAGLRYKKVVLVKAKVYVGELLMDAPEKFVKSADGALASLDRQKAVAIRMSFLRDVDGEKISKGFQEGLEENKVALDSPAVKRFLEVVKNGGEAKEKSTLTVLGERLPGGKEAVSYENSAGKIFSVTGDPGLIRIVFSIWFGKIDDSGLESLRDEMLGLKQ